MQLCLLCLIVPLIQAIPFNVPTNLSDGLLITGGAKTRRHVATWTVVVSLDSPTPTRFDEAYVRSINRLLLNINTRSGLKNSTLLLWKRRFSDLVSNLQFSSSRRSPRGIFNFISDIGMHLFGFA